MKKENGYWIDDNNNRWNCNNFSEDEAMINSFNCNNCYDCHNCHNCDSCYECHNCHNCHDCHSCYDCHNCHECSKCHDCHECSHHVGCRKQTGNNEPEDGMSVGIGIIPKIENIHQQVLNAASRKDALDMGVWHTCETTHCRAGWVVHLAGKAGYDLQKKTSCCFAAMQIYKASSEIKVAPVRVFETADKAMADMNRCAELESAKLE